MSNDDDGLVGGDGSLVSDVGVFRDPGGIILHSEDDDGNTEVVVVAVVDNFPLSDTLDDDTNGKDVLVLIVLVVVSNPVSFLSEDDDLSAQRSVFLVAEDSKIKEAFPKGIGCSVTDGSGRMWIS